MSRPPRITPPTEHAEAAASRTIVDSAPLVALAHLEQAVSAAQVAFSQRIGERIGRRRAADAFSKLVTVTDLLELQQIKDSREYRGLSFAAPDGKVVTVTTWADFCEVVEGRSVEKVDLDLLNVRTFGAGFMEAAQRMGIGYRELREMRAIPADQRSELVAAAQLGDRETLIDIAESLIERHAKEKTALEAQATEAQEVAEARQRLIDEAGERYEKLLRKTKFKPSADRVARDAEQQAQLAELTEATNGAEVNFLRLAGAVDAITAGDSPAMRERALQAVQYLVKRLVEVVDAHAIEVSLDGLTVERPEWLNLLPPADAGGPAGPANAG